MGNAEVAVEVKISERVHQQDLKGLIAFCEEHPTTNAIVVSQDQWARQLQVNELLTILILTLEDLSQTTMAWGNYLTMKQACAPKHHATLQKGD